MLRSIARIAGREVPHETAPRRPGDPAELVADTALSRQLLGSGLTPRSDLDSIISTALAWHRTDRCDRLERA